MENTQEELKAHLMQSDEEFRQLAEQHAQYHEQLEALEAKSHLTPEEEVEEHRLKKVKLQLKDQMNANHQPSSGAARRLTLGALSSSTKTRSGIPGSGFSLMQPVTIDYDRLAPLPEH